MDDLRLGALCWTQSTDWPSLLEAGKSADRLGYHSLWAWDHVYPIMGAPHGPIFEGWLTITAWAAETRQIKVGHLVGANPFRNPALVAKMATTLDHISGGRTYLGLGAGWNEEEHLDYGFEYGSGFPERLRWLGEALPIIRGMLHGNEPSATGPRYAARHARNDPPTVQATLPILVGGGGEKVTLKLVAQYADANNLEGLDNIRRKEPILREHCERIGRDEREIERTASVGVVVIRDSRAEAQSVFDRIYEHNRISAEWQDVPIKRQDLPVGTSEDVVACLAQYVELGYRHLIANYPAPYDEESMTRLATEVKPNLERT
jgi:alkanesulfonate monooxygenase SsuD/methylene tetrahydromethanopterin reductase-like flavin-dependent oxidoreductase (luciferase family)